MKEVLHIHFEKTHPEELTDKISRRFVNGEEATLTRLEFKKGALVAEHSHPNEQITYIIKGSGKMTVKNKEYILQKGDVLVIPPNIPHMFEAVEDTTDLSFFVPIRKDWLKGQSDYLKK